MRIAVLIPAWNAQPFIGAALDSVWAQTRAADDIVVVDDGSEDGTRGAVQEWSERRDTPVSVLRQQRHGCAAARNLGLRTLDADLVATLDADDLFLPGHLQRAEAAFRRHPRLVLYFADVDVFSRCGIERASFLAGKAVQWLEFRQERDGLRLLRPPVYASLLAGNYIAVSTSVYRLAALRQVGLYDESLINAADRDLNLRLSRVGDFAYYPGRDARKRVVGGSLSDRHDPARAQTLARQRLRVLEKMLEQPVQLALSAEELRLTRRAAATQTGYLLEAAWRRGWKHGWQTARNELPRRWRLLATATPWPVLGRRLSRYGRARLHRLTPKKEAPQR